MSKSVWAGIVVWAGLMAAAWWWLNREEFGEPRAVFDVPRVVDPSLARGAPPDIRYPLPQPDPQPVVEYAAGADTDAGVSDAVPPAPEPLPELADSDEPLSESLALLVGEEPVESFLIPDRLIEKLVLTVHRMDGEPLPQRFRPIQHTRGLLVTRPVDDQYRISDDNYARYDAIVDVLASLDSEQTVDLYLRYYPLFQKAFADLGETRHVYFNDRVIDIIDHLLDAPSYDEPPALVRPKVLYRYADPAIEELSVGHKTMIRIGSEHAEALKQKLRELRAELISRSAGQVGD